MDLRLDGQVALVAGSSRGIGLAIATTLLDEGARVALTGRDAAVLRAAHAELAARAGAARVLSIAGDLTTQSAIGDALDRTLGAFGRVDHVIANVGTGSGPIDWNVSDDDWHRLFDENFFASTRLLQAALPHLLAAGEGSVLFIASIVAVEATTAPLPYAAAKAALVTYSKNLARRLAPSGIRVNAIAPGNVLFDGGSWARHMARDPVAVKSMLESEVPAKRFGRPEEIASLAAYLCSPLAAFITGGCYVVDGGQTRSF